MLEQTTLTEPPEALSASRGGSNAAFSRFAWGVLAYLVLVIQFGAWVRITGSGAGCGSHWPTCHGEIVPRAPAVETIIEYTHRVTSGLLGLVVVGLVVWAMASRELSQRVRIAAWITLAFTVLEAAIGAKLVLSELVASNDSAARAVVVVIHLASTFTLTAASGLVAWWSTRSRPSPAARGASSGRIALLAGCGLLILVSMTGAVTALGDTLFPVEPTRGPGLLGRIRDDLSPAAHFLVRLRIVHPVLAVAAAGILIAAPSLFESTVGERARPLLEVSRWLVLVQTGIGVVNIALGAPGFVQLIHLFCAQAVWLALVFATAESFVPTEPARA